jgi:hypothetical protein
MGYDASCTITIDGHRAPGTAWLEHKELVFRGPFTLKIPLAGIEEATARDGTLQVRFGGRQAEFAIGAAAARWAERITHPPSRATKLGLKPGMQIAVVRMEDAAFEHELCEMDVTRVRRLPGRPVLDAIFVGIDRPADLDRLPALSASLAPAGALWVVRRKGREAQVSERDSMAAGKRAGLVDVKVVSFSEERTAEKFVIPVAKRGAPRPSRPAPRKRG